MYIDNSEELSILVFRFFMFFLKSLLSGLIDPILEGIQYS